MKKQNINQRVILTGHLISDITTGQINICMYQGYVPVSSCTYPVKYTFVQELYLYETIIKSKNMLVTYDEFIAYIDAMYPDVYEELDSLHLSTHFIAQLMLSGYDIAHEVFYSLDNANKDTELGLDENYYESLFSKAYSNHQLPRVDTICASKYGDEFVLQLYDSIVTSCYQQTFSQIPLREKTQKLFISFEVDSSKKMMRLLHKTGEYDISTDAKSISLRTISNGDFSDWSLQLDQMYSHYTKDEYGQEKHIKKFALQAGMNQVISDIYEKDGILCIQLQNQICYS